MTLAVSEGEGLVSGKEKMPIWERFPAAPDPLSRVRVSNGVSVKASLMFSRRHGSVNEIFGAQLTA